MEMQLHTELKGVQSISYRHEGVMLWLLANPHRKLSECARELGYTLPWISTLIHSDLFQLEYKRRSAELGMVAGHTISARLMGIGQLAMERVEEKLRSPEVSDQLALGSLNSVLDRLGYGSKNVAPVTNNNVTNVLLVDKELLEESRQRIAGLAGTVQKEVVVEVQSQEIDDDE